MLTIIINPCGIAQKCVDSITNTLYLLASDNHIIDKLEFSYRDFPMLYNAMYRLYNNLTSLGIYRPQGLVKI